MERHTSLHEMVTGQDLTIRQRVTLCLNLALAMSELYRVEKGHGHLTPKNVFVTDEKTLSVKVSDITEHSLRHNLTMLRKGDFRSVYQSLEVL